MYSTVIKTRQLTEEQIHEVYMLHKQIYCNRGIGFPLAQWKSNLLKSYHKTTSKNIQLTKDDSDVINGYLVFTSPILIHDQYWSKILEGGFKSENNQADFLTMIDILTKKSFKHPIIFFGETSMEFRLVLKLMVRSGFKQDGDLEIFNEVFRTLLNSLEFKLVLRDNNLQIIRKTSLTNSYHGNVLFKESLFANVIVQKQNNLALIEIN